MAERKTVSTSERIPPQATDVEQAVLGAMLVPVWVDKGDAGRWGNGAVSFVLVIEEPLPSPVAVHPEGMALA